MVDLIMGVHPRYSKIDIYVRVMKRRPAVDGLATLDGHPFHLSRDARGLFRTSLQQIADLGVTVALDTRSRLSVKENPDDPGSWITASSASTLSLETLLQVSADSNITAMEVYENYLEYAHTDLPIHVSYNQISIEDLFNPEIFSLILTHKLKMDTPQKIAFESDKARDLTARYEWLSNVWKTIAVINNKVQKMKLKGIKQPADNEGGSANIAIWDKFSQIKKLVYEGIPIKQSDGGFNSPFKAFQSIRSLGLTINSEFQGMGDIFMRYMLNNRVNLDGWQTWVKDDVNTKSGWGIFRNPQSIGSAQILMNRFKAIAEIGSTSFYSKVMESKKIKDLFAPKHLCLFINHFIECITQSTALSLLKIRKIEELRNKNVKKYASFQYSDALILNYATQYLRSIFTMTELDFNNFMSDHVSDINGAWSWNPECKLDLSGYTNARTYFGAFNPQSRLEIPKLYGTELRSVVIDLDSDFEAEIGRSTFELTDGDIKRIIPINSQDSPYTKWYGRQQIRHWSHHLTPTRERVPVIDFKSTNPLTHMYYDMFLQLQEGRAIVVEVDGGTGREYMVRKDMNVYTYIIDWNLPIISVVRDNNRNYYLHRCLFIGHISPLLSETEWSELNSTMINNRANGRLQFEEMLTDIYNNWELYGLLSQNIAKDLQERFGMDTSGEISSEFRHWWEAFRNSYTPKVGLMWYMTGYDLIKGEPIYD